MGAGIPQEPKTSTGPCCECRSPRWPHIMGAGAWGVLVLWAQESYTAPLSGCRSSREAGTSTGPRCGRRAVGWPHIRGQQPGVTSHRGSTTRCKCRCWGCPPQQCPSPRPALPESTRGSRERGHGGDTVASCTSAMPGGDPSNNHRWIWREGRRKHGAFPPPSSPSWCRNAGDPRQEATTTTCPLVTSYPGGPHATGWQPRYLLPSSSSRCHKARSCPPAHLAIDPVP